MLAWGETWCGWEAWQSLFEVVDFRSGQEADTFFEAFGNDSLTAEKFVVISKAASRNVFQFVKHLRISFDSGVYMNQMLQFRHNFSIFLDRSALSSITFRINEWGNGWDFMVFTTNQYPPSLKLVQIVSHGEQVSIIQNQFLFHSVNLRAEGSVGPTEAALVVGGLEGPYG